MLRLSMVVLVAALASVAVAGGQSGASPERGRQVFKESCQACHRSGGFVAGLGPRLAERGLSEGVIRGQVERGGGLMPAGLVAGADLDDVVAYVRSIQPVLTRRLAVNAGIRRALAAAHRRRIRGRAARGPLAARPGRPRSRTLRARRGRVQWAIATFAHPGRGTAGQPQILRRVGSGRWVDLGPSRGCLRRVPAPVRRVWGVSAGRCR